MTPSSRLPGLFAAFYRFAPVRLALIFLLTLIQAASAGIGLLFLLPLLHLVGLPMGGAAGQGGLGEVFLSVFARLHIPLRLDSLLFVYVALVSSVASLNFLLSVLTARVQQEYVAATRGRLYRQILGSRWQFILRHKMSDLVHGLGAQVQSLGTAAQHMLALASRTVVMAVMVALAFLLSWRMSLLAVGFAGALLLILWPLNRRIYGSGREHNVGFKSIFRMLSEQLASLKMIKSYGGEARYAEQVERAGEAVEAHQIRFATLNALSQWVYMVSAVTAFALFTGIALTRLSLPLPNLMVFLLLLSRLLPQASMLQKTYQQILNLLPAVQDLEKISRESEAAREAWPTGGIQPPRLEHSLVLDRVSYRYPAGERDILREFSAIIPRNRTVSLVGPSGAGKSTLADLIAGLLEPASGTIYCDGVPLEGEQRIAWRQSLAYVTQEVFLFHDTVRANLRWVAEGLSEADLWEALRAAAADEFVARFPQGLDTVIGDRGTRLSGGERQRLALARALLSKPRLLILDEATSALDQMNEEKIKQALDRLRGKLTIVIIAHRETTIEHADECIRLGSA